MIRPIECGTIEASASNADHFSTKIKKCFFLLDEGEVKQSQSKFEKASREEVSKNMAIC